jgi:hypothetical protein
MDFRCKALFIASIILLAAGCNEEGPGIPVDDTPPSAVSDLMALNPTDTSMVLRWTAPGDDSATGTAARYDIRFSTEMISESNWSLVEQSSDEPSPQNAGQTEICTVSGLVPATTYYFAMKSADERMNWSALSNITSWATEDSADVIPPAAISDLIAILPTENSITLEWTAPGDDSTAGTAEQYYIRYSKDSISDETWNSAMQAPAPPPKEAGSRESATVAFLESEKRYYFAIKSADEQSNMSPLSNVVSISTTPPVHQIQVTDPNAGTTWYAGQADVPISWHTGGIGGYIRIYMYKSSELILLTPVTPNDGYYGELHVPYDLPPGEDYRIRVYQDNNFNDFSDYFKIRKRIEITSPDAATIWFAGQRDVVLSWNTMDLTGTVSVFLCKGDDVIDTISTDAQANCLFYEYDVPAGLEDGIDYQIMVYYNDYFYTRSPCFQILSTIVVTAPSSESTWKMAQPASVLWQNRGIGGNVSIVLYKGEDPFRTISPSTPNDGSFEDYIVPADLVPARDYRVLVSYDEYYFDFSDEFVIVHEYVDIDGHVFDMQTGDGIPGIIVAYNWTTSTTDATGYYFLENVYYADTLKVRDEDYSGPTGNYYDAYVQLELPVNNCMLDIWIMPALQLVNTVEPDSYEGRYIKFFKDITNTHGLYGWPTVHKNWKQWPIKIYNPPMIDHGVDVQAYATGAMAEWESMTGYDLFIEVDDPALADVEIVYFDTLTAPTPHHVVTVEENPDGTPARKEIQIYQSYTMVPISIYPHLVFAHELGHVLGLKHSKNPGHLMLGLAFPIVHHVTEDEANVVKILYNAPSIFDYRTVIEE